MQGGFIAFRQNLKESNRTVRVWFIPAVVILQNSAFFHKAFSEKFYFFSKIKEFLFPSELIPVSYSF